MAPQRCEWFTHKTTGADVQTPTTVLQQSPKRHRATLAPVDTQPVIASRGQRLRRNVRPHVPHRAPTHKPLPQIRQSTATGFNYEFCVKQENPGITTMQRFRFMYTIPTELPRLPEV